MELEKAKTRLSQAVLRLAWLNGNIEGIKNSDKTFEDFLEELNTLGTEEKDIEINTKHVSE